MREHGRLGISGLDRLSPYAGMINPLTRQRAPEPPVDKRVLYAEMVYPFAFKLHTITIIPPLDKEGRARIIGFITYHEAVPVIDKLLEIIFGIKNVLDGVILVVGFATVLALILMFALSLRIRQREIDTTFNMGCSRMTIARLVRAEILIVMVFSGVLCAAFVMAVNFPSHELVRALIIR